METTFLNGILLGVAVTLGLVSFAYHNRRAGYLDAIRVFDQCGGATAMRAMTPAALVERRAETEGERLMLGMPEAR